MSPVLAHDDWSPPDEVEEYKLIRQIGRGTMGQVYLARDRMLDRLVAIKFITAVEPEARGRFLVEARAAARIQHPNVVAVHRVGELNNRPYLITEFVRGPSLAQLGLPLPWQRALGLGLRAGVGGRLVVAVVVSPGQDDRGPRIEGLVVLVEGVEAQRQGLRRRHAEA